MRKGPRAAGGLGVQTNCRGRGPCSLAGDSRGRESHLARDEGLLRVCSGRLPGCEEGEEGFAQCESGKQDFWVDNSEWTHGRTVVCGLDPRRGRWSSGWAVGGRAEHAGFDRPERVQKEMRAALPSTGAAAEVPYPPSSSSRDSIRWQHLLYAGWGHRVQGAPWHWQNSQGAGRERDVSGAGAEPVAVTL